jgi:hypothetical protein
LPIYGRSTRDHVINLQLLFSLAHRTRPNSVTIDPTTGLSYQRKTGDRNRLSEGERFAIYQAACRETDPFYKFPILFGLFHGVGPAEICEADTRDVIFVGGVPVFMIRPEHREGDEKTLSVCPRTS